VNPGPRPHASGFGVEQLPLDEFGNIAWDELSARWLLADANGVVPFTPAQLIRVLELVRALVASIALISNESRVPPGPH
jgi:hypothetical protein